MCLGEVCEVREVSADGSVFVRGTYRDQVVQLMTLPGDAATPTVKVGDWLVVHAGFAIGKLTPEEAKDALDIRSTQTPCEEEAQ